MSAAPGRGTPRGWSVLTPGTGTPGIDRGAAGQQGEGKGAAAVVGQRAEHRVDAEQVGAGSRAAAGALEKRLWPNETNVAVGSRTMLLLMGRQRGSCMVDLGPMAWRVPGRCST